jgi:lambda repressor-like predicted transcriptional regulator
MNSCKPRRKTEQDKFTLRVKTALLREGKTITDLARTLRLSRNGVSRAINHPVLPTVRRRIAEELNV